MAQRLPPLTLVALTLVGCTEGLPRYSEVTDLRILAVRAEPPELPDSSPPAEIRFDALVVDPSADPGDPISLRWQLCPVETGNACEDFEASHAQLMEAGVPVGSGGSGGAGPGTNCPLSTATLTGLAGFASAVASLGDVNTLTTRFRQTVTGPSFTLSIDGAGDANATTVDTSFLSSLAADLAACDPSPLPPDVDPTRLPTRLTDLHLLSLLTNPLGALSGTWPSMILEARSGEQVLVGEKRMTIGFLDLASPLEMLRVLVPGLDIGVSLCAPGQAPVEGCLAPTPRDPNTNPVIEAVHIAQGSDATGSFDPLVPTSSTRTADGQLQLAPVRIEAGSTVRVLPVMSADSEQAYQSLNVNLQTRVLELLDDREEITISWFVTHGRVQDARTWVKSTRTLDTVFSAPDEPPEETGGEVRLWMVARDQRGGTAWQELRLQVEQRPLELPVLR